jgi:hypothetical protein
MVSRYWPHISQWIQAHETLLGWLGALSIVFLCATMITVPVIVLLLPPRYLVEDDDPVFLPASPLRTPFFLLKNAVGVLFVLAGLAMLLLPGQGLLTIFIGLTLIDFPAKRKVIRWIIGRKRLFRTINRFRAGFHRPPLEFPARKGTQAVR